LLYAERRTALVDGLRKEFGSGLEIFGAQAGMYLSVILPGGFHDLEVATRAARENLLLQPLSPAYIGGSPRQGFVLGFGSVTVNQMPEAIQRLKNVLKSEKNLSGPPKP
jgi:GntR family transcriptional regulator/MocR family aminotransferase